MYQRNSYLSSVDFRSYNLKNTEMKRKFGYVKKKYDFWMEKVYLIPVKLRCSNFTKLEDNLFLASSILAEVRSMKGKLGISE